MRVRRPAQSVPENNLAERVLCGPSIGRQWGFGFDSEDGRPVHRNHVLGRRYALDKWHRRAALAGGMAEGLRQEWRQTAGRPVALAAMVDERGAQMR